MKDTNELLEELRSHWIRVEDAVPEVSSPYPKNREDERKMNKVMVYTPSTIGITTAYFWGPNNDPMKGWSIMGVVCWLPLLKPPMK